MLVFLIPPSVYDLGQCRIITIPLEHLVWEAHALVCVLFRVQRIVFVDIGIFLFRLDDRRGFCRLCRPIEDRAIESCDIVEQEVIELVVLDQR